MGLQGNLTAGEIVEQLAYALRFSGIRNIVFMGMGEPLNNYKAVKVRASVLVSEFCCTLVDTCMLFHEKDTFFCPRGHDQPSKGPVSVNRFLVVPHHTMLTFFNNLQCRLSSTSACLA